VSDFGFQAYSQFKLWVVMKSPLVLGTHWSQLADLKTLEPTYFALLTNPEILAINHDPSPQVRQLRHHFGPNSAHSSSPAPPGTRAV